MREGKTIWRVYDPHQPLHDATCTLEGKPSSRVVAVRMTATGEVIEIESSKLLVAFRDPRPAVRPSPPGPRQKRPTERQKAALRRAEREQAQPPKPKRQPSQKAVQRARPRAEKMSRAKSDDSVTRVARKSGPPAAPERAAPPRPMLPSHVIGDGIPTVDYYKRILRHRARVV